MGLHSWSLPSIPILSTPLEIPPNYASTQSTVAIVFGYVGALAHGTHSGMLMKFALGFFAQLYLRKYRANWFVKYNYILSAGLDGGTSLINFILTFTVFGGGAMKAKRFPPYWGNNWQQGMHFELEDSCYLYLWSGFSGNGVSQKLTSCSDYTNKEKASSPYFPPILCIDIKN